MQTQRQEKHLRKRKKRLLNSIRDQMEFYFSDANLRRDKFMSKMVEVNDQLLRGTQFVDINQFLKFNKISELTQSVRDISLAIESSKCLQMDGSKSKVKRVEPFIDNKDTTDDSTIYVERLPPNADQQWIRSLFQTYGKVEYVKLPRFRHNNSIMGFAFIEFDCPESALKACTHFGALSAEDKTPETNAILSEKSDICESDCNQKIKSDKRPVDDSDDQSVGKKIKLEKEENESDININDNNITVKNETSVKKKKKRKRRRKTVNHNSVEENEVEMIDLRVMSKKEWKSWKNKYLKLQKSTMSSLKQSLFIGSKQAVPQQNTAKKDSSKETFESGLILKLSFIESSKDFNENEFKRSVRSIDESGGIAFVDLCNNQIEFKDNQSISRVCYIRCKCTDDANRLITNKKIKAIGDVYVLTGVEESDYWKKINEERDRKRSNANKKVRGFDKIINRAERGITDMSSIQPKLNKHIIFDH